MSKKSKKKARQQHQNATRAQTATLAPEADVADMATSIVKQPPKRKHIHKAADFDPQPWKFSWLFVAQVALIVGVVFGIYYRDLHGLWLWDDDYLIRDNGVVHSPEGILEIWFDPASLIDFFPLTVSLEWLIWQMWPNDPFPYHLTSVILHIITSLLVWNMFRVMRFRLAWLGGLLFAIHPVTVESVAWMAEIKNTLATPFFVLAATCWVEYDRTRKSDYYFTSLGLFLVAMLCKTTMVMFPFLVLFYAWWRRDRIRWKDILDSIPFFGVSFAIGMAVIIFLRHGVGEELTPLGGADSRLACAGMSLSFYFSKSVLPIQLFPIYPEWTVNPPTWDQFLAWPVFGVGLWWLWNRRRQPWARNILFGFGFFIINLLPFIGFRMISFMRFTWVMDHFLYIPILGIIGIAIGAASQIDLRSSEKTRPYRVAALAVLLCAMAGYSYNYAQIFNSQEKLWTYTITHNPWAWPAYNNLGNVLSDQQRLPEAKWAYDHALAINPYYPEAHNNLGRIYAAWGQLPKALDEFNLALKYCPDLQSAQQNKAAVLQALSAQQPPR